MNDLKIELMKMKEVLLDWQLKLDNSEEELTPLEHDLYTDLGIIATFINVALARVEEE